MDIMNKFEIETRKVLSHISYHPIERKLYSHDISVLPKFLEKFSVSVPDAVIQPESVEEVLKVLEIAKRFSKPVVPRGAATSAYGGVVPYNGGIVVDFTRMDSFEIDEERKLLISEPGAVWCDVQKEARKKGLSLRVYPTSAPSSTVGGWISHGGYGIGSLMFGSIRQNVEALEVVDFSGKRSVRGDEIKYFVGLQGTTGLIVSAEVKLMDYSGEVAVAHHFRDYTKAVRILFDKNAYSATIFDSGYIKMLNEIKGTDYEEKNTLLIAYLDKIPENETGNAELGKELWDERFYPLRIKKKGPSIVSAEVILPWEMLDLYCSKVSKILSNREYGIQVFFARSMANVIILIPSDERSGRFTKDWKTAFKLIKLATKLSGKPYSTGMYLSYGSKKWIPEYEELEKYKRRVDPDNLLNPGKVFPTGKLPAIMKMAEIVSI